VRMQETCLTERSSVTSGRVLTRRATRGQWRTSSGLLARCSLLRCDFHHRRAQAAEVRAAMQRFWPSTPAWDRSAALGHWPLTCDLLFFIPHHQRGIPHQESSFLMLVKAIFLVDSGCSFSQSTTEGYLLSLGSLLGIGSNCLDVSGPKRWC
jgi:hypothetical protein